MCQQRDVSPLFANHEVSHENTTSRQKKRQNKTKRLLIHNQKTGKREKISMSVLTTVSKAENVSSSIGQLPIKANSGKRKCKIEK